MACWTITHLDHSLRFFFILYILFSHSTPHLYDLSQLAMFFLLPQGLTKKEKQKNLCAWENEESGAQIGLEEEHTKQEGGGL